MPARRLLMRKIREVLRLKHERGLSHRAIAQACTIGVGTVTLYLKRTAQRGLGWPLPAELDDAALEAELFPRPVPVRDRVRPDCAYIHRELKRDGVTLQLLWDTSVPGISPIDSTSYGRRHYEKCNRSQKIAVKAGSSRTLSDSVSVELCRDLG